MNWLAQNWYWAVLAVGVVVYWLLWSGRRRADAGDPMAHGMLARRNPQHRDCFEQPPERYGAAGDNASASAQREGSAHRPHRHGC